MCGCTLPGLRALPKHGPPTSCVTALLARKPRAYRAVATSNTAAAVTVLGAITLPPPLPACTSHTPCAVLCQPLAPSPFSMHATHLRSVAALQRAAGGLPTARRPWSRTLVAGEGLRHQVDARLRFKEGMQAPRALVWQVPTFHPSLCIGVAGILLTVASLSPPFITPVLSWDHCATKEDSGCG